MENSLPWIYVSLLHFFIYRIATEITRFCQGRLSELLNPSLRWFLIWM
jgi:hypothetical protein